MIIIVGEGQKENRLCSWPCFGWELNINNLFNALLLFIQEHHSYLHKKSDWVIHTNERKKGELLGTRCFPQQDGTYNYFTISTCTLNKVIKRHGSHLSTLTLPVDYNFS